MSTTSARYTARAVFALLGFTLLIAGCSTDRMKKLMTWSNEPIDQSSQRLAGTTQYECDGARRLAVRFGAANQPVMMVFPDREFRLDPVAGSPGRYSNTRSTFIVQGDTVTYEEPGTQPLTNCKRPAAPAKK